MCWIVRKLENKRNWDDAPWLRNGDVHSAVSHECLRTTANTLSVYVVDEDDQLVRRVLAALALNRDNVQRVDLAVVSQNILPVCNIRSHHRVLGETPDLMVNDWHVDLRELSVTQVADFAKKIKAQGTIKRYMKPKVIEAITSSFSKDWIETNKIREPMRASLQRNNVTIPQKNKK